MEYEEIRQDFEKGNRLLIVDLMTLGGKILDIVSYFSNLPSSWAVNYFHTEEDLQRAIEEGSIKSDSIIVLPSVKGVNLGYIWSSTSIQNFNMLIISIEKKSHIPDRERRFYWHRR